MVEALFDTSVIVDHLRGLPSATAVISSVKEGKIIGYISTLTEAELFAGKDEEDEKKSALLADLLEAFDKIEVNSKIARDAGRLKRKYGISLADAIIGATAMALRCRLYTKDAKAFGQLKEIVVQEPY